MELGDIPIGKYGYFMNGDLFKVPDNSFNRQNDHHERIVLLFPGTLSVIPGKYPVGTPCKDAPKWNNS